ncbi:hypothetical protein NQ317_007439 [Molorchus minor]|uniref:Uncharacterized protein n=1 Tax=Molorchus minor TaxID=1323400 RepID=A0ABQ9JIC4_9CUCU|nr:hypothetical protein NQ317_007439 [Molorchus minor]
MKVKMGFLETTSGPGPVSGFGPGSGSGSGSGPGYTRIHSRETRQSTVSNSPGYYTCQKIIDDNWTPRVSLTSVFSSFERAGTEHHVCKPVGPYAFAIFMADKGNFYSVKDIRGDSVIF